MDLRQHLDQFANAGSLHRIRAAVDLDLELAALCRREFAGQRNHALLFEQLWGKGGAVAANLFGSPERMAAILRCDKMSRFADRVRDSFGPLPGDAAKRIRQLAGSVSQPSLVAPLWQQTTPRFTDLPAIRSWPRESRPYLTLPLVVTRQPQSGTQNLGLYRVQLLNESQAALNLRPGSGAAQHLALAQELRQPLPVALVFGSDLALSWLAAAPLPEGCDEFGLFRSWFTEGLPLAQCATSELLVPADAEYVVEGVIRPGATCVEGPFGNHSGQYVNRSDCPLLELRAIACRSDAIMPLTVVGPPPSENIYLARTNELLIREMLRIDWPQISDLYMPEPTLFHAAALLQVGTGFGAGRELIEGLWREGPLSRSRLLVLVDEDIDPAAPELVYWRLVNRLDSRRIYQRGRQLAIDATGVDPRQLVVEDPATARLLRRRSQEYSS